jgi:hypothetical protein
MSLTKTGYEGAKWLNLAKDMDLADCCEFLDYLKGYLLKKVCFLQLVQHLVFCRRAELSAAVSVYVEPSLEQCSENYIQFPSLCTIKSQRRCPGLCYHGRQTDESAGGKQQETYHFDRQEQFSVTICV